MGWVFLLMIGGLGGALSATALEVGAAKRIVTPTMPVYLAGLRSPRLSDGVHDDLYARALALSDGTTTALLVGVDLIGVPRPYVERARALLIARGVPAENLIVCATHQHSGPDTIGLWGPSEAESGVNPAYIEQLIHGIVEAAEEAFRTRKIASAYLGVTTIPEGVARNTRVPGYHDKEVRTLRFVGEDNVTVGTLVNFTAHPEVLGSENTKITADYPAYVYRLLDGMLGGITLFLNGALGGMVTPDASERTFAEAERIGTLVAEAALTATRAAQPLGGEGLFVRRRIFSVPIENERFQMAATTGVIPLPWDTKSGKIETEVNLLRLGHVTMATIPGELLPQLGFLLADAIRETGAVPFLLGLANDELGYILPEEDFDDPLYRYESSVSVGRTIGSAVMEHLKALLKP